jgi:glutamine synthetase
VENSKGEAGIGQQELNVRYAKALEMSDHHAVYKQCLKEIADQVRYSQFCVCFIMISSAFNWQEGKSVTFMAKPFSDATGSGCHVHLSLWHDSGTAANAFVGDNDINGIQCSDTFLWFLGGMKGSVCTLFATAVLVIHLSTGWLKHAPACMPFYAPTVNSYKRFRSSSWAPTRLAWSYDNRTAGFRVVGAGKSLRIECRIPGADINPCMPLHLVEDRTSFSPLTTDLIFAASLASGLDGIRHKIEPPELFEGNIYEAQQIPEVPKTLTEAVDKFEMSEFTKQAFGSDVVEHYAHFYRSEQAQYDASVTDWERRRYFEQI